MYHGHPLDRSFGTTGLFPQAPHGTVVDRSGGKAHDLRPDMSRRNARRLMIQTSMVEQDRDGTFIAKIRPARGVVGVKLAYASIPRAMSTQLAQLVLYSIPIRNHASDVNQMYQRLHRNLLLSANVSDVPFFTPGVSSGSTSISTGLDFDFTNTAASGVWVEHANRDSEIPVAFDTPYANQRIDVDTLTVRIPYDVTMRELGEAFRGALAAHTGLQDDANNSILSYFNIAPTDTGFSVEMNRDQSNPFNTYALFHRADETGAVMQPSADASARNIYEPMYTPITITLDIAREVYIDTQALTGAANTPSAVSSIRSLLTSYKPVVSGTTGNYTITINDVSRTIYTLSFPSDVMPDNLKSVSVTTIVEAQVSAFDTGTTYDVVWTSGDYTTISNGDTVTYYYSLPSIVAVGDNLTTDSAHGLVANDTVTFSGSDLPAPLQIGVVYHVKTTPSSTTFTVAASSGGTIITLSSTGDGNTIAVSPQTTTVAAPGATSGAITLTSVKGTLSNATKVHVHGSATLVSLKQVEKSFQRTRDMRLGLRWPGRAEGADFTIDGNYSYESTVVSGKRQDVAQMETFVDNVDAVTYSEHNALATTQELPDTFIPGDSHGIETHMLPLTKFNDADQQDEMLFCGHFVNALAPTAMAVSTVAATSGSYPSPTNTSLAISARYRRPASSDNSYHHFYARGGGWQTSIVQKATKYIMPAYPVRYTQTSATQSIYQTAASQWSLTSISPLVARILNRDANGNPFYMPVTEAAPSTDMTAAILADLASSAVLTTMYYFVPRTFDSNAYTNAIVVALGNQNYVIKSARLISVVYNETEYTLDLSCDRHASASTTLVQPRAAVDESTAGVHAFESAVPLYTHSTSPNMEPTPNARYWTWVFELDREVELPLQVSTSAESFSRAHSAARTTHLVNGSVRTVTAYTSPPPPVAARVYGSIAADTALLCAAAYYRNTGRPAVSRRQEAPHRFHVRATSAAMSDRQTPLLKLHGIGNMETPINSTGPNLGSGFALIGTETDQRKALHPCTSDNATWFHTPQDFDRLVFSFVDARTGAPYAITQNATMLLDIYAANE